jgi:F0F1-type ATP synthase delta subunit
MNVAYEDIYINIHTVEEKAQVLGGIEIILEHIFKQGVYDMAKIIDTEIPYTVAIPLKTLLIKPPLEGNAKIQREFLEGLRNILDMLRIINIEIAFDPTKETISLLAGWIRKQIGKDVIMQLTQDRTLLAGARISFEGRYKEVNLSSILEMVLNEKKESINAILYG